MNFGQRLVLSFFVVFYFVPAIGNAVFEEEIFTIYTVAPLTVPVVLQFLAIVGVFLIVSSGPRLRVLPMGFEIWMRRTTGAVGSFYRRIRLWVAILALPLVVQFVVLGFSSYRYANVGISDTDSSFALFIILLNATISIDLFYCMFVRPREQIPFMSRRYIENVLLALLLLLSANGTGGLLVALTSMAFALAPISFHRIIFVSKHDRMFDRLRRGIVIGGLAIVILTLSWIGGETIKLSSSGDRDLLAGSQALGAVVRDTPEFYQNFGYYLISAISSYYYSAVLTAQVPREVLSAGAGPALGHPLETLLFRLDHLTGGFADVARPEHGSLSRLNYLVLTKNPEILLRGGSSPGVIASFNYVSPFPLNIIFSVIYLCWVGSLTNRLLSAHRHEKLSAMGLGLLLFYMLLFFQSPFDFLQIFDNSVLYVFLIISIAMVASAQKSARPAHGLDGAHSSPSSWAVAR